MTESKLSVSELSAGAVSVAFASAVLYVYGMSMSSSIPIFDYMAISDYLTFSIKWLAPTLVLASVGAIIQLFLRRVEGGLTEDVIAATTKNPKRTTFRRNLPFVVLEASICAITFLYFIGWRLKVVSNIAFYDLASGTLPIVWVMFAGWYFSVPRIIKNWTKTLALVFIFVPALLVFSFLRGLHQGEAVLSDSLPNRKIVMEDTSLSAEVVLTLDGYYLIREKGNGEVRAIKRSRILEVLDQLRK